MIVAKNSWGCTDTINAQRWAPTTLRRDYHRGHRPKTDATAGQSNGAISASATGGTGFSLVSIMVLSSLQDLYGTGGETIPSRRKAQMACSARLPTIGSVNPCAGVTTPGLTTKGGSDNQPVQRFHYRQLRPVPGLPTASMAEPIRHPVPSRGWLPVTIPSQPKTPTDVPERQPSCWVAPTCNGVTIGVTLAS